MSELTPITREEALLDGQDLTPITRQEMFIKHIYDASQEIPEPITREERFLKKAAEGGGGGDITVEPLSVTENGTYTAPTGKAYSPVSVSVPLPQNAHLATAIESQPVTDASDYPLPKCDVTVTDADKCEVIVTDDGIIVEDNEPYNFRQSAGGDTELDELIGGTVAWNQLVENGDFESASGWNVDAGLSMSVSGNECTVSINEGASGTLRCYRNTGHLTIIGHVYVLLYEAKSANQATMRQYNLMTNATSQVSLSPNYVQYWILDKAIQTSESVQPFRLNTSDAKTAGNSVTVRNVMFHDLTLMFGSTIADYIYSLEQSTAGAGVAWLKEHFPKLFDDGYKAYNAGQLASVKATAHETVGFNQWDEEVEIGSIDSNTGQDVPGSTGLLRTKGFIPILPNETYYNKVANWGSEPNFKARFYDANKDYIGYKDVDGQTISINSSFVVPANAKFLRFQFSSAYGTTYNNDICINISDAQKNGTYEPYVKHSYPLSPVELRGLYKLDSNNKLYCYGDNYRCDGQVKRRYGIVDLGTFNWTPTTSYSGLEGHYRYNTTIADLKQSNEMRFICSALPIISLADAIAGASGIMYNAAPDTALRIETTSYSDALSFKAAMSGVMLVYELATSTEEYTSPFEKNQVVDAGGTEEYIDTRDVAIPVGHATKYYHGKAYVKYFPKKTGVVEMADEGIMPMNPMHITANGEIDAEYWR